MTPSLNTRLCNIGMKPGISAATQLITTRRICRAIADQLDVIRSERRALRRQAGKLKAFIPFTRQAIAELEERAQEHQEAVRIGAWSALAGFGQSLMFDREGLAQALGFDQMCDLLGVNPVHRQQASADGDTSLRGVAYLSQLEDSADRKSREWAAGGPLYRACHAAMIRFIRECPEDQLPDPFAPGAPFGPKLPPALSIVGNSPFSAPRFANHKNVARHRATPPSTSPRPAPAAHRGNMTDQDSNTTGQAPTHRERFAEACKITDFAVAPNMNGGYLVWEVQHVRDGQKVTVDGPFFTEDEGRISADLLRGTFRGARAYQAIHCWAWNPDPRREKAIRDDAMASRMMLAMQIGAEVPTHTTNSK